MGAITENSIAMVKRPKNIYSRYHAHVYFDADTVDHARWLCHEAGRLFGIFVGHVHERLVGPHPHWSCQLIFDSSEFEQVVPWLEGNRQGLTILVHGDTGDDLEDHTLHAMWLGNPSELNLAKFRSDR